MQSEEYLKLVEVEDHMWYFRSLHGHVQRELSRAGLPPGARVLDAGCGTGGLLLRLRQARPDLHYSGFDFSPLACALARKRCGPELEVREASITALPYPDGSFDAVLPVDVLSQVDNPGLALAECHRVLKPGGVLILNTPAYMWLWSYHDVACETKRRYGREEIRQLLAEAGFRPELLTHWNALPFPALVLKRKVFPSAQDGSNVTRFPAPLERALNALMSVEHGWIQIGGRWPWGSSIFGVARKT
ncbi:MAG: hypothetical protein RIQ93_495 [Verrucomicrobiota bacterium]|jgi:SAM-dependent methyltransferase